MNQQLRNSMFTAILILCSAVVYSQSRVSGKIFSKERQEPAEMVSVCLAKADSSLIMNTLSDQGGHFAFPDIRSGDYIITYSQIAYVTLSQKLTISGNMDLGTIELLDNIVSVDDVVVTAASRIESGTKTIAYPTANQVKISTTGIDLLQKMMLPGLFVDPIMDNISIVGTSGVVYRINGINSTLWQIKNLKADKISRVEYSQSPTIRELESNSGVINVILKESQNGTEINVDGVTAFQTIHYDPAANIRSTFGKSQFAIDYLLSQRGYTKIWTNKVETFTNQSETITRNQIGRESPFNSTFQRVNFEYLFSGEKNILSVKFLNTIGRYDRDLTTDLYFGGSSVSSAMRKSYSNGNEYYPSVDLYYIHKFSANQGVEVNVVGTIMNSKDQIIITDTYSDHSNQIGSNTDGSKNSLIFESLYYNKIKGITYNLGIQGAISKTHNVYGDGNVAENNNQLFYCYGSIGGKKGSFSYSLGSGIKMLKSDNGTESLNYYRNLSTLTLLYSKPKWSIRNSSSYTPSFPSLLDVLKVDLPIDELMVMRGNPDLRPSQTLTNRLNFSYNPTQTIQASFSGFVTKEFKPISSDYFYDPVINSFVQQSNNQISELRFGGRAEFSVSKIMNFLNISGNTSWTRYGSKGELFDYSLNDFTWGLEAVAQKGDFALIVAYRKPAHRLYGQIVSGDENYSPILLQYKKNRLTLLCGVIYAFSDGTRHDSENLSTVVRSSTEVGMRDNANMAVLRVSYSFSWGRTANQVNKKLNNYDDDSGVVKNK